MFGWEFPPHNSGGLGVACQGLVRALAKKGVHVTFVLPRTVDVDAPYTKMLFADRYFSYTEVAIDSPLTPYVTSRAYERQAKGEKSLYGANLMQEVLRYAAVAMKVVADEQFDVVYAHDWLAFPAGIEVKRITGKPLIVHVHSTEFDRCGGADGINQGVYEIEKRGMEEADRIIAVSAFTKNIIVSRYGIPESKVRVIHNGLDGDMMPSVRSGKPRLKALKESGYSIVLFLGRITLQKGPDYFVRAAARVVEKDPNVMFILSGAGDMEHSILELAASLGISKNILFSGFLRGEELREAYELADLFVMPSVSEPFGIAALEAIHAGTPVLISKQSGVSEVLRHALKVDFWDVDEMANKILSVVRYPSLSHTLTSHASKEAQVLSWNRSADCINSVLDEVSH